MIVKSYVDTYGFPANITNCSNNYGLFQFLEKLIRLVICASQILPGSRWQIGNCVYQHF